MRMYERESRQKIEKSKKEEWPRHSAPINVLMGMLAVGVCKLEHKINVKRNVRLLKYTFAHLKIYECSLCVLKYYFHSLAT